MKPPFWAQFFSCINWASKHHRVDFSRCIWQAYWFFVITLHNNFGEFGYDEDYHSYISLNFWLYNKKIINLFGKNSYWICKATDNCFWWSHQTKSISKWLKAVVYYHTQGEALSSERTNIFWWIQLGPSKDMISVSTKWIESILIQTFSYLLNFHSRIIELHSRTPQTKNIENINTDNINKTLKISSKLLIETFNTLNSSAFD